MFHCRNLKNIGVAYCTIYCIVLFVVLLYYLLYYCSVTVSHSSIAILFLYSLFNAILFTSDITLSSLLIDNMINTSHRNYTLQNHDVLNSLVCLAIF